MKSFNVSGRLCGRKTGLVGGHHGEKYNMYYIILYYMLYVWYLWKIQQKRKFSF